jgi:hypothetical protein
MENEEFEMLARAKKNKRCESMESAIQKAAEILQLFIHCHRLEPRTSQGFSKVLAAFVLALLKRQLPMYWPEDHERIAGIILTRINNSPPQKGLSRLVENVIEETVEAANTIIVWRELLNKKRAKSKKMLLENEQLEIALREYPVLSSQIDRLLGTNLCASSRLAEVFPFKRTATAG